MELLRLGERKNSDGTRFVTALLYFWLQLCFFQVCVVDAAFKNSHKGERFSDAELLEAFGTSDITQVLQSICEKGEVQQNAGDRKKMMEDKRKQVVQYLAKYYINPLSKKPHPAVDLENALEAAKVKIDLDTPGSFQFVYLFLVWLFFFFFFFFSDI